MLYQIHVMIETDRNMTSCFKHQSSPCFLTPRCAVVLSVQQPFMCTSARKDLDAHVSSKHSKMTFVQCFPTHEG